MAVGSTKAKLKKRLGQFNRATSQVMTGRGMTEADKKAVRKTKVGKKLIKGTDKVRQATVGRYRKQSLASTDPDSKVRKAINKSKKK